MLGLASILDTSAKEFSGEPAIVFGDKQFTYAQLNGAANQIANGLVQAGIQKGDRVALTCPNLPYFPMVYYGILKAGAVVVPLNVLFKTREVAYHLKDSGAKAYLCFQGTPELPMGEMGWAAYQDVDSCEHFWMMTIDPTAPSPIEGTATLGQLMNGQPPVCQSVATSSEDTAVILYTSGTTGQPKGAELSQANMFLNALFSRDLTQAKPQETQLVVLPLFHSFGQTVQMNAGLLAGHRLVLLPRFEAEAAWNLLKSQQVNIFCGVPTMYWALLNHAKPLMDGTEAPLPNLRLGVSGGASLPLEILKGFEEQFKVPIIEGYGLSETSPVATFNHLHRERKPGSIGTPIWGVEVKTVDLNDKEVANGEVGEIIIRGHNVMKGYYQREDATATALRNGWFHSGDLGRRDDDGYFYIVDRLKDMILRGGYNVYPREVEEVLLTHPAISLVAVIGVPHESHGEEIKACVVLNDGMEIPPDEIVEWSKQQMADYKYPRIVEIRDSLPMTATGKILKKELRK